MAAQSKSWRKVSGRRLRLEGYGLMNDAQEGARLTLEHHLMKLAWRKNYLAPIQAPEKILDVACGSGIWGYELLREWPQAQVVNLDNDDVLFKKLVAELIRVNKLHLEECAVLQDEGSSFAAKPRFLFTQVDARQALPFGDGTFDFTHARSPEFLSEDQWPGFIRELARVTKPDGFVEIVTLGRYYTGQLSQAATELFDAGMRLAQLLGVTLGGLNFSRYLQQAGVPGEPKKGLLGKGKRQQELLLQDILHAEHQVKLGIVGFGIMSQEEVERLIEQFQRDARAFGLFHPSYRVFFQPKDLHPSEVASAGGRS